MGMSCFTCKDSNLGNIAEETIIQIIGSMRINQMSFQEFIVIMNDFYQRIIRTEDSDEDTIENNKSNFILIDEQESKEENEKPKNPMRTRNISFKEESKVVSVKSRDTNTNLYNPKLKTKTNTNLLTFKLLDKQSSTRVNNYKSNLREVNKAQSQTKKLTINFSNVTVTDSNLKTYLSFYIQEHFMDSNSLWGSLHSAILPDLTKVKIKNYKLLVMSWAIGFLTDPDNLENLKMQPQTILFGLMNQIYGSNFTKANIKEFLSTYLIFNTITLNDCISKVFKSKFSTVINGMFINVEFLQSLDFITKEVFNSKIINTVTSKLQSLIIDNREEKGTFHYSQDAFDIKEREVFNTLICTKSLRKYIYDSYKNGFN